MYFCYSECSHAWLSSTPDWQDDVERRSQVNKDCELEPEPTTGELPPLLNVSDQSRQNISHRSPSPIGNDQSLQNTSLQPPPLIVNDQSLQNMSRQPPPPIANDQSLQSISLQPLPPTANDQSLQSISLQPPPTIADGGSMEVEIVHIHQQPAPVSSNVSLLNASRQSLSQWIANDPLPAGDVQLLPLIPKRRRSEILAKKAKKDILQEAKAHGYSNWRPLSGATEDILQDTSVVVSGQPASGSSIFEGNFNRFFSIAMSYRFLPFIYIGLEGEPQYIFLTLAINGVFTYN